MGTAPVGNFLPLSEAIHDGSNSALAQLTSLRWRVVYFDGAYVTLWLEGPYRSMHFMPTNFTTHTTSTAIATARYAASRPYAAMNADFAALLARPENAKLAQAIATGPMPWQVNQPVSFGIAAQQTTEILHTANITATNRAFLPSFYEFARRTTTDIDMRWAGALDDPPMP